MRCAGASGPKSLRDGPGWTAAGKTDSSEQGGYIYDPAVGDPDGGIEPGTAFEDIPEDWVCPVCGVGKDDFSLYEE